MSSQKKQTPRERFKEFEAEARARGAVFPQEFLGPIDTKRKGLGGPPTTDPTKRGPIESVVDSVGPLSQGE
ncbi:hypothetical protein MUO83_07880 [Candidatus Bathyarchaeota archaeon]|nr:hypothetical protein [Candidatus Bathyarchaeota archaeon]